MGCEPVGVDIAAVEVEPTRAVLEDVVQELVLGDAHLLHVLRRELQQQRRFLVQSFVCAEQGQERESEGE